jgi:GTP cyclohydrolase IB
MNDVQNYPDLRGISLEQVGVKGLRYRIRVAAKNGKPHEATATVSISTNLPHTKKGTHMSRLLEVFSRHHENISMESLPHLLEELQVRLKASSARVEMAFPIFLERAAPVTGAKALLDFDCRLLGQMRGKSLSMVMEVRVPVTSLCPCSRDISKYGAHNQRGTISISVHPAMVKPGKPFLIWFEDLIALAEGCGSSQVYPLLKRPDEKYVTEFAYENPAFVEDMVRNVAVRLQAEPRVAHYSIEVENFESIHNHSAFGMRTWSRMPLIA